MMWVVQITPLEISGLLGEVPSFGRVVTKCGIYTCIQDGTLEGTCLHLLSRSK